MKPGRDLDLLIAEKFFNLRMYDRYTQEERIITAAETLAWGGQLERVPRYSTDIAAAWEVAGKLARFELRKAFHEGDESKPIYYVKSPAFEGTCWAKTAPHAICLAALKAVGAL